jgi:hypothetical protein
MSKNQPNGGSSPTLPPWVKVFVIIFVVILALVIALHLMGFGFGSHRLSEASSLSVVDVIDTVRRTGISINYPLQVALTYNVLGTS